MNKQRIGRIEKKFQEEKQQLYNNRKLRFKEFLGDDCGYIEDLLKSSISPYEIKDLLDKGCPKELIPKILL